MTINELLERRPQSEFCFFFDDENYRRRFIKDCMDIGITSKDGTYLRENDWLEEKEIILNQNRRLEKRIGFYGRRPAGSVYINGKRFLDGDRFFVKEHHGIYTDVYGNLSYGELTLLHEFISVLLGKPEICDYFLYKELKSGLYNSSELESYMNQQSSEE